MFLDILIIIFFTALYFLPALIGYNKKNIYSILALNLLLGWTAIGWIVALVWALSKDNNDILIVNSNEPKSVSQELTNLKKLYDDGVLTELEFEKQKKRLLE